MNDQLAEAIEQQRVDAVRQALDQGADSNAVTRSGLRLPLRAAMRGNLEIIKLLLDKGARFQAPDIATALPGIGYFEKCKDPSFVVTARVMASHGASPRGETAEGESTLEIAAKHCATELAEFLLQQGADPNRFKKTSPLESALKQDNIELTRKLLEAGADPNREGQEIPLIAAFDFKNYRKETVEIYELLLRHGANPNLKNRLGYSAGQIVKSSGRVDADQIMRLLLSAGGELPKPTEQEIETDRQNAVRGEKIGKIALGVDTLAFGQLSSYFGAASLSYRNVDKAVVVVWHGGVIEAVFDAKRIPDGVELNKAIPARERAIELTVTTPFAGTLSGVKIGDRISKGNGWNSVGGDDAYLWKAVTPNYRLIAKSSRAPGGPLQIHTLSIEDQRYMIWIK